MIGDLDERCCALTDIECNACVVDEELASLIGCVLFIDIDTDPPPPLNEGTGCTDTAAGEMSPRFVTFCWNTVGEPLSGSASPSSFPPIVVRKAVLTFVARSKRLSFNSSLKKARSFELDSVSITR